MMAGLEARFIHSSVDGLVTFGVFQQSTFDLTLLKSNRFPGSGDMLIDECIMGLLAIVDPFESEGFLKLYDDILNQDDLFCLLQ